jgi:hypothetical protein
MDAFVVVGDEARSGSPIDQLCRLAAAGAGSRRATRPRRPAHQRAERDDRAAPARQASTADFDAVPPSV